mgnify:CR=1 FL=1
MSSQANNAKGASGAHDFQADWTRAANQFQQNLGAGWSKALEAFQLSCKLEGIIPALEPSHALAHVMKIAPTLPKDHIIVMNMCGRGDKDIFTVAKHLGFDMKV